jgi:hypothetical protein
MRRAPLKSHNGVRCMLCSMRLFEVFLFLTDKDLDLALSGGVVAPERVASTHCLECGEAIGFSGADAGFSAFALVIDEHDNDWTLCADCAAPVTEYSEVLEAQKENYFSSDDLDFF